MNRTKEQRAFIRGAAAASSLADDYNASTTHPLRLGDCIMAKLNLGKRNPRKNRQALDLESPDDAWCAGYAVALAEVFSENGDGALVRRLAEIAGITLALARAADVSAFDIKRLKRAGIK